MWKIWQKNYIYQLDKLREAMFYVAGRVFNFNFSPVKEGEVPVFHEDVKVWEVTDKDGKTKDIWKSIPLQIARQLAVTSKNLVQLYIVLS